MSDFPINHPRREPMHSYQLMNSRWWVFCYRCIMVRGAGMPFPEDKMILMKDFDTEDAAAAYTNYLNGGIGHTFGKAVSLEMVE